MKNMKKNYKRPKMSVLYFPENYCEVINISGPGGGADTKGNNVDDESNVPWYQQEF